MNEINSPIDAKSSERFKSASDDNVRVPDLLQQLNRSHEPQTSAETPTSSSSSMQDLLAYEKNRHNQEAKAQNLTSQADELLPGTFTPENPPIVEVLTPAVNTAQAAADLELLTQIVGDFFSQGLNSRMETKGCHQSNRIFSHQAIATPQIDSTQIALSSSNSEQAIDVIAKLTQEIDKLLHHRLVYERERRGSFGGCLPW